MNAKPLASRLKRCPLRCASPWLWLWVLEVCARLVTAAPGDQPALYPEPFSLKGGDVLVFTGGASLVAAQENACLETLITLASPPGQVRFRTLAWEGDTVYEQRRELNFGSWHEQLAGVDATVIFAQFGQMESLQATNSAPQFIAAYEKLRDQFTRQTPRLILLSPFPFERAPLPLPDLSARNQQVEKFSEEIRALARKRSWRFVDLFTPFRGQAATGLHLTENGFCLGLAGHWAIAREIRRQLGFPPVEPAIELAPATAALRPQSVEHLRELIQAKNRLWFDYWRPMNWAFLHGDRTEQPSSRDHRNPAIRWFPDEMKKFLPLIVAKEQQIAAAAAEVAKEIPSR